MDCFGVKMKTQMHMLLEAVRFKNKDLAYEWKNTDTWITLEHLLEANSPAMGFVSIVQILFTLIKNVISLKLSVKERNL